MNDNYLQELEDESSAMSYIDGRNAARRGESREVPEAIQSIELLVNSWLCGYDSYLEEANT